MDGKVKTSYHKTNNSSMLLNLPKKNISFCVTSRSFFNTSRVWGVNTPAKCPGTPKNLSLPHLCISQKNEVITTPTSHLQITISAFLFVWLPTWGSEWGEDRIWVWRGEAKGCRAAGHVCAHLVLYKTHCYQQGQHGWWLNTMPPHPLPARPLGACSGHTNIRRFKSYFS